jgi:hypothetical protein
VIVGDEAEELFVLLVLDHLLHHAEVVSQVQGAGGWMPEGCACFTLKQ